MVPEVEAFFQWLLANGQNQCEWVLMYAKGFENYANSTLRQQRLKNLTDMAHLYGLQVGADVPIALVQQHAWTMVTNPKADIDAQIAERLDWVFDGAGFDFLNTGIYIYIFGEQFGIY